MLCFRWQPHPRISRFRMEVELKEMAGCFRADKMPLYGYGREEGSILKLQWMDIRTLFGRCACCPAPPHPYSETSHITTVDRIGLYLPRALQMGQYLFGP